MLEPVLLCIINTGVLAARKHDVLYQKGMCESRGLFRFWEISDNISLTVQDRDVVATEHLAVSAIIIIIIIVILCTLRGVSYYSVCSVMLLFVLFCTTSQGE